MYQRNRTMSKWKQQFLCWRKQQRNNDSTASAGWLGNRIVWTERYRIESLKTKGKQKPFFFTLTQAQPIQHTTSPLQHRANSPRGSFLHSNLFSSFQLQPVQVPTLTISKSLTFNFVTKQIQICCSFSSKTKKILYIISLCWLIITLSLSITFWNSGMSEEN